MKEAGQNLNVQKWVAGISILLLAVKFIAYYFTNSVAILTDALESIVNVAAGFIGLYSLYVSAKPRDRDHPYGHGKAEFLSAAVEGTLIGVAGTIILYEATRHIIHPVVLKEIDIGIWLVAGTAAVNYIMGYFCVRIGKKNNSLALEASGKHLQSDTYSTVGIIIGLILLFFTNYYWIDSAVAILFGFIIIYTGYRIIRQSIAGIMDEADEKLLGRMVGLLNQNRRENWVDLHNLRVIKYGSTLHLDCHLTVLWTLNVHEAHAEVDALSKLVKKEFGESVEMFVHSDGCMPFQCPICDKENCPVRQYAFIKQITWTLENIRQDKKHRYEDLNKVEA
ncbi:MAG TPA: cation diffusion facilitator family transporter [Chitinophagaceae bacterium]|nr:cation diffusion facilitator family transporter [Chitinophagaceae bacterium]